MSYRTSSRVALFLLVLVACDPGEETPLSDGGVIDASGDASGDASDRDADRVDWDSGVMSVDGGSMCGDGTTQSPESCDERDRCVISGTAYDAHDLHPDGTCQICDPTRSRTDWTPCPTPAWRRAWPSARAGHSMVALERGFLLYGGHGSVAGQGDDEVLRWDGRRWHDETHLAQPLLGMRHGMSMAYDAVRDRVVVFGGSVPPGDGPIDDSTFERAADGTWSASPAVGPEARMHAAMAYDPEREIVVLFAGRDGTGTNLRDTWQYDGSTWTELTSSGGPVPRHGAVMAYDPARGALVLHGGTDGTTTYDDTWEWDGSAWLRGDAGPRRSFHAMTYDARAGALLVWGGTLGRLNTAVAQMHARDASGAWSDVHTPGGPSSRNRPQMAYDASTRTTYLFGGYSPDATFRHQSQLFAWDATGFHVVGEAPTPRVGHAMAYDSGRDRTVLFGGRRRYSGAPDGYLRETWEWDGVRWELVSTTGPEERAQHAMAYDPVRGVTVLYGSAGDLHTWEWDGSRWTAVTTRAAPGSRIRHAMAYDPEYGGVLLMGGFAGEVSAETWLFDGDAWTHLGRAGLEAREDHSMTYDQSSGRVLLCGGRTERGFGAGFYAWMDAAWSTAEGTPGFCSSAEDLIAHDRLRGLNVVVRTSNGTSAYLSEGSWTTVDGMPGREGAAMASGPRGAVLFGGADDEIARNYGFESTWVFGH